MSVDKHINNNQHRGNNLQEFIRWGSHIGAVIPLLVLAVDYFTNNLTANPIQTATQKTGDIALILLVLMLAVTPILIFYQTNLLKGMRKRLGLYAFFYTCVHLYIFFVLDYGLDWNQLDSINTSKTLPYFRPDRIHHIACHGNNFIPMVEKEISKKLETSASTGIFGCNPYHSPLCTCTKG